MKENFTKSDLKTGMWVETRDNQLAIALLNTEKGDTLSGQVWMKLDDYSNNLTVKNSNENVNRLDIIKVYEPIRNYDYVNSSNTFNTENWSLIWERKEVEIDETKVKFNELEEVTKPLIDYINKYYDTMTRVVVSNGRVDVLRAEIGIPLEIEDTEEVKLKEKALNRPKVEGERINF